MGDRRVVVTGLGAVTPLGVSAPTFWDALVSGKGGVRRISRFDPNPFDSQVGGECLDFNPSDFLAHRENKRMDRFAQLGFASAKMAMADSGLESGQFDPTRAGVIIGTGIGGLQELEDQHKRLISKGPGRVSAFTIPKLMANAASASGNSLMFESDTPIAVSSDRNTRREK